MEHCALGVLLSMLVFDYCLVLLAEATIWERGGGGSWERGGGGRGYAFIYTPKHFFFLFFMYGLSDRISKYHVINLKTVMKIDITLIIITVHYEYLKKNYT